MARCGLALLASTSVLSWDAWFWGALLPSTFALTATTNFPMPRTYGNPELPDASHFRQARIGGREPVLPRS